MSTAQLSAQRQKLPFGLQPHHITFALYLSSIVILGTTYSIVFGTHLENVRISSGAVGPSGSEFPSTLPGATVAPYVQTGVDGSTNLGPIPPTILLPPHHVLNYWANRKNIVNQIFVKKAWLWTTFAWALQLFFLRLAPQSAPVATRTSLVKPRQSAPVGSRIDHKKDKDSPSSSSASSASSAAAATITSPVSISVLRYIFATSFWLLFANWFFGPPLAERILTYTGAVCVPNTELQSPIDELYCRTRTPLSSSSHPALFSASSSSKTIRPMWRGGHDISGHTFIMVLSSLLLLEDIAPYLAQLLGRGSLRKFLFQGQQYSNAFVPGRVLWTMKAKAAVAATLALVGLWSWMLWNTAIYFHTPQEKVSGLIVGLFAWLLLPKGN
ncbi:related to SCS3 - protein required for inositol prototrophy [Melanopsichium pennsylvanicum]|uniref:Related to SCS3 - protein required for inositol prototrophy n=2 Tax=Melanopsichium pennsylvanicum TaxID=63383 RepID=A0AAJ4XSS3_9BASI|nr:conserved hypothetical protein [Melanopsichium pennsylvanicum 4]SNX86423.1 related to SCS3 - protein required for inositol prototrophy [Melanopsichium pennsylvanicum]